MHEKPPANEALRQKDGVTDQSQQQIDLAGKHRVDPTNAAKQPSNQPGHDLQNLEKANDHGA